MQGIIQHIASGAVGIGAAVAVVQLLNGGSGVSARLLQWWLE